MLAVVVEVINSLISHQVAIIEEQSINTQTIGQLKVINDVPVVLQIDTEFIKLHTGSRLRLTVITVSEGHDLRIAVEEQCRIQHVVLPHGIGSIETVITCTITHIHVVCHLILITDTGSDLVVLHVVSHIVLDVPDGVVNGIVPGKQLIAERHIVVAVLRDIDMGEWR